MNRKRSAVIFVVLCITGTLLGESHRNVKNTENEKVIIAFIDSACSTNSYKKYEKLLWNNEKEIDGNVFTEIGPTHCDYVLQAFSETLTEIGENVNYEIMILDVLGIDGKCSVSDLVKAIKYAETNGAQICNLSLSTYNDEEKFKEVIKKSTMLFVAAAGNEGENLDEGFPSYPSNYNLKNVISVAAVDENNELLETSNYGEKTVDIAMNGILQYENDIVEGTSIAAGRVTAIVAALYCKSNTK